MFSKSHVDPGVVRHLKSAGARLFAQLQGDRWLGVAPDQLVIVRGESTEIARPWTDAESAKFDGESRELTIRWIDGTPPLVLAIAGDDVFDTVQALRERITASIVHVEILSTGSGDVRALIRRGSDGQLFSQLIARGELTDAERAEADALESRAREAVGLTKD